MDFLGVSQEPILPSPAPAVKATVEVKTGGGGQQGEPFSRGDVDQSGTVNITDAIGVLGFLFNDPANLSEGVQKTIAECLVAFNVDGSVSPAGDEAASSVSVTDVIVLLSFLFQNGTRPAAPFKTCGLPENDINEDIRCVVSNCP